MQFTEIIEANFSAFVYRLFHEDVSSIDGTNAAKLTFVVYVHNIKLSIEHSTTCDSRINLNCVTCNSIHNSMQ